MLDALGSPLRGGDGPRAVIRLPAEDDLEGFVAWLRQRGRTERTIEERVRYLRKLSERLGALPTIEGVLRFFEGLNGAERDHYRKALRLWLRYSGQRKALEWFEGGWESRRESSQPGIALEEAFEAVKIAWSVEPRYALYLVLLLVTGLRPSELRAARRDKPLAPLVFEIEKPQTTTKRHSYAFLTPAALELRDKLLGSGYDRLAWYRRQKEHECLKVVREKLPSFRPYDLRALNAQLLIMNGVPVPVANYIQGRAPEDVLRRHYLDKQLTREEIILDVLKRHNQALRDVDTWIRQELIPRLAKKQSGQGPG